MGAVAASTGAMGERGMIPQTEQEHWEMLLTKKWVVATSVWPTVRLLWFFSGVRNLRIHLQTELFFSTRGWFVRHAVNCCLLQCLIPTAARLSLGNVYSLKYLDEICIEVDLRFMVKIEADF